MVYNLDNQEERNLYAMSEQEKQGFIPSFYGRKGLWIDEGDDYYTIDNDEVICSCWDDESVKLHTPNRKYFATEKEPIDIGDDFINKIEPSDNGVFLETTNSHKIFKNDYARVSFITAYCRLKMYQNILKYVENLDDIIMINTDGFATKTEIKDIPISSEIGKFKVKHYKSFIINHLSDIKKIE